jgi:hypothetical protein
VPTGADVPDVNIICTLFYEEIPALNRYSLVLLALLMLSASFVGVRRLA